MSTKQQRLTDAIQQTPTQEETVQDDRVVEESLTCDCGRPAGADGLCYGCRMDKQNGGRRL